MTRIETPRIETGGEYDLETGQDTLFMRGSREQETLQLASISESKGYHTDAREDGVFKFDF